METFLLGQFVEIFVDPQEFLDRSVDNAPFSMFVLLPFYALLLKLVYIRSGKYFVEHVVFALHLHSLAFLLLTVQVLLPADSVLEDVQTGLLVLFFVYYYLSLRRFYNQSRLKTVLKYCFLVLAYSVLMAPSILATFVLSAAQL